mgnify:FL=1
MQNQKKDEPAEIRKKENQEAEIKKQKILIEYIAMMADVKLPEAENQEGESYE